MAKYIPISLIMVSVLLAVYLSGKPREKLQLRRLHIFILIYVVIWCLLCLKVYPLYVFIE